MASNSKIEWTTHTFNPWWGCVKVSPACRSCYAESLAKRYGHDVWGVGAERRHLSDDNWKQPVRWNRAAAQAGERHRVFCASMADVFENRRDLDSSRDWLWSVIAGTPNLDWLLLTKRPEIVRYCVPWTDFWPANVWIGTTVEDQTRADERLPELAAIPLAKAKGGKPRRPGALGLGHVNAHHQRLKQFINGQARGVSTKFLPNWLGWSRAVRRPGFDPILLLADTLIHRFV